MELNKIYEGSCFDLINEVPENFIDLVVTSPPYADTKSYGKKINVFHPDNYVDWILPLFKNMYAPLKETGSIIFNINDKCHKKLRHDFVFELILRVNRETDLKLYDYYIWEKTAFLPNGGKKRLNNATEWILHFVKNKDKVKWNMDDVREPYAESTINRMKSPIKNYKTSDNGIKDNIGSSYKKINKNGKIPTNVFNFNTAGITRGNKHPAPFHKDLPSWFIKALTDENDIVLDPFMGSGTTANASEELNRRWLGFELNPEYIKMYKPIKNNLFSNIFD